MTLSFATLAVLAALAAPPTLKTTLKGHEHFVHYVVFDGDTLVSASWDKTVRRWDVAKGKSATLDVTLGMAASVSLSADGSNLATGIGKTAKVWDLKAAKEAASFDLKKDPTGVRVALSPDGKTLAVCESGLNSPIRLLDVATGKELAKLPGHFYSPSAVALSADGKLLVSAGSEGEAKVWDVKKGELVADFKAKGVTGFLAATFSPDGRLVAAGGWLRDNAVRVWEVGTKKEVAKLAGHGGDVRGIAFSPDGKLVATASYSALARNGEEQSLKLWDAKTWKEIATLDGHKGAWSVAFSKDGKLLASGGGADKTIKLWDVSKVGEK